MMIFRILFLFVLLQNSSFAGGFLVKDGEPLSEIVISGDPQRSTRLAARELQIYIEKISGEKLKIVSEPGKDVETKIYVGRSSHTEKLKISGDGLKHGAYRIKSGANWLVLIGDDTNFIPREPWPRNNKDVHGRVTEEWERATGQKWGHPLSQMWKRYKGNNTRFGRPEEELIDKNGNVNVWTYDERGSFNAVCGFLRGLGVRWYLPGELGEVLPSLKNIPLREIDKTVHPDFEIRNMTIRWGIHDTAMWGMHLGMRESSDHLHIAHGLALMTNHDEKMLKAHPEWFALYGGKRQILPEQRYNHLCYSNEELIQEAARFARAQFDLLGRKMVSIMPPDGYTAMCQCALCEGKDTPERGYRGGLSDYVWSFVNRVAKEVGKTHPDKMISCCAYGTYTSPPEKIARLEPNLQVIIVGGRRPTSDKPEEQEGLRKMRERWQAKTDHPLLIYENYPFTDRGWYLPSFVPHTLGEGINATKGSSRGEDIWFSINFDKNLLGYNHFPIYFTQRMYWGGKEQDVDVMFNEYCTLFYGPAAEKMKSFFEYSETNWREMEKEKEKADVALERFAIAKNAAAPDSIYARRMALIDEYLERLRSKSRQLGEQRGPVPQLRIISEAAPGEIVIDGNMDEEAWEKSPYTGRLKELQTGRAPALGTSFKAVWGAEGSLYFGIRCDELSGEKPNATSTKHDDQAIWYGDLVEIELQTDSHSYYQIAVNSAAAIVDLDRGAPPASRFSWSSRAEVATRVEDDHWTVEIRIPVVQDENDPLNQVIGNSPSRSLPWHFNVCRQRVRGQDEEHSSFSPTGKGGFHKPLKFAHLYRGLSHHFPFAKLKGDYFVDTKAATDLMKGRKTDEALQEFVAIAGRAETDLQKSASLQQAAVCARSLKDYLRAAELADQIPLQPIADTVRMETLLAQRSNKELIEQYGEADFSSWPFWQRSRASLSRGRAFMSAGHGKEAESDFKVVLSYANDRVGKTKILRLLGTNRLKNLNDEDAALEAFQQLISENKTGSGYSDYFGGVLDAARILTGKKRYDEALATLEKVDIDNAKGTWPGSMRFAFGETLAAAGRKEEAVKAYRAVISDVAASAGLRENAEAAINSLQTK